MQQNKGYKKPCNNGENCKFFAQNNCRFYHPQNKNNNSANQYYYQRKQGNNGQRNNHLNTVGCIAINPLKDQILLVKLRWTRSGAKKLFHILSGKDEWSVIEIKKAVKNCTDDELNTFNCKNAQILLNEKQIPQSWSDSGNQNIEENFEDVKKFIQEEIQTRQEYKPDKLASHEWVIPKGGCKNHNQQIALEKFLGKVQVQRQDVQFLGEKCKENTKHGFCCYIVQISDKYNKQEKWDLTNDKVVQAKWFSLDEANNIAFTRDMVEVIKKVTENYDKYKNLVQKQDEQDIDRLQEQMGNVNIQENNNQKVKYNEHQKQPGQSLNDFYKQMMSKNTDIDGISRKSQNVEGSFTQQQAKYLKNKE